MESILISILSYNRRDGAKDCIDAVLTHAPGCKIVLTNNGSSDGTKELFDEYARANANVTVFHEKENTGFQFGHNRAFRMAAIGGNRFFFCLNDDVIISNLTVDALVSQFNVATNLAICGDSDGCSAIDHDFHGAPGKLEYVEASAMMVNVPLIAGLRPNLFSDELEFAYGEDSDLSLFVREKGLGICRVDTKITHLRGQTSRTPEVKAQVAKHQKHNHEVNLKRWSHYLKVRKMDYPVLIRRKEAIGDVILTTPIIRAIKQGMPLCSIVVETKFPQVFDHNPNVDWAAIDVAAKDDALVIDLNLAYENMPQTHILHAYEKVARELCPGMAPVEMRTELFPEVRNLVKDDGKKIAVIHTDNLHWAGKNIPSETLSAVVLRLQKDGWSTVSVGSDQPRVTCMHNSCGQTSLLDLATIMQSADLFVGPDSAPFHVAQAMGCPTVVLYGCTRAKFIATRGSPHAAVESSMEIEGSGERHTSIGKVASSATSKCMESISVERVMKAIEKLEL